MDVFQSSPHMKRSKTTLGYVAGSFDSYESSYMSPKRKTSRRMISATTTPKAKASQKSLIAQTPIRLNVVHNDWTAPPTTGKSMKTPYSTQRKTPGRYTEPSSPTKSAKRHCGDRYIPSMATGLNKLDFTLRTSTSNLSEVSANNINITSTMNSPNFEFRASVAQACGYNLKSTRILEFQPPAPTSNKPIDLHTHYTKASRTNIAPAARRKISTTPERVLDAPGLIDDYYLNLLDWSCDNQIAVGLDRSVYVWDASSGTANMLSELPDNRYVASVSWSDDGAYVAIGTSEGDVEIWDVEEQAKLRVMKGHLTRVASLSWSRHTVSSGAQDGSIWNHDVRVAQHKTAELNNHTGEVCGLKWRADGCQLASGGNDNVVNIWDKRQTIPQITKTNHNAAVKALAWSPWQVNLLASGGGSSDKNIHFWNTTTGSRLNTIETESQVTSLTWSTSSKEIVSTHGYPDNKLVLWNYQNLNKVFEVNAHESRILYSSLSPDGTTLATAAADENLKFWKLFNNSKVKKNNDMSMIGKSMKMVDTIR